MEAQVNLAMALAQLKRRVEAIDVAMAAIALAREQKKATLASQLEHWLTDYRSQLPESPPQPH